MKIVGMFQILLTLFCKLEGEALLREKIGNFKKKWILEGHKKTLDDMSLQIQHFHVLSFVFRQLCNQSRRALEWSTY